MSLSTQTLDYLLEAETHLRAAIRSASSNEKPLVIQQISQLLVDIEKIKKIEDLMDMLDKREPGSSGSFGTFFD